MHTLSMVLVARRRRAVLATILASTAVAGCGGLGNRHGDASQTDDEAVDLAQVGADSAPLSLDSTPIHIDAENPQPDAGNGLEAGSWDADNTEAGGNSNTDAISPFADAGLDRKSVV